MYRKGVDVICAIVFAYWIIGVFVCVKDYTNSNLDVTLGLFIFIITIGWFGWPIILLIGTNFGLGKVVFKGKRR